jgi:hypothetical protein
VVEDFVDGERVGGVVKIDSDNSDLFTTWILRVFYAMFAYTGAGGGVSFSAPDDTGAVRSFWLKGNFGSGPWHIFNTNRCAQGVRVRYGLSSTPSSRNDYKLLQEIYVDSNPRLVIDEDRSFVMVESVVSFGSDTTVCEVGLSLFGSVSEPYACGDILLDRTVFSPCRSIPAGTPYTVRYRVQL